jgi:protein-L-isoaspartate(D-aspartate) O-methyltransferase
MTRNDELMTVRRVYAKQIVHAAGIENPRLEEALANLRREDFLPPGPWKIWLRDSYLSTPNDDPVYLYQDAAVAVLSDKRLNNGKPFFVAFLISIGRLQDGEHAVHIGTGLGYYTAVMSRLVGTKGRVTAFEYEPDLASRAAANLTQCTNVRVVQGDGSTVPLAPADAIYVNAGVSRPAESWLDALRIGGRIILPLTVSLAAEHPMTRGVIFLIERQADHYSARCMSTTVIYPCVGARDEPSETALVEAFQKGGWDKVTRLYRTDAVPEERCWVHAPGWSLAYE